MARLTRVCLALAALLFPCAATRGQTQKPCEIVFENLSRETFTVRGLSLLQSDGSKKEYKELWPIKPSERLLLAVGDEPIKGRQVFYTLELPDGTRAAYESRTTRPLVLGERDVILQAWDDGDFAGMRKDDKDRELSKGQATYRYWNTVHGIFLEESFDAIQSIDAVEPSKFAGIFRTMANRIDDLDTSGIDDDAVAAAKAYAAVLREVIKVLNGFNGPRVAAMMADLYQRKVDRLTTMLDETQMNRGKLEDISQFMRSSRKALEKRYQLQFPHLIPPVVVGLPPFTFSKGYYVSVLNTSGDDLKDVEIRYRDAGGRVKYQSVTKRLTFSAASTVFDALKVDPSRVKWTVETGEWIAVLYEGGGYSYSTSKLIKKR